MSKGAPSGPFAEAGPWTVDAACLGLSELMTISGYSGPTGKARTAIDVNAAKAVCATCPVIAACRAWALTDPDPVAWSIAGGLDPDERAAIRARRAS